MADNMNQSDRTRAQAAAETYQAAIAPTIDQLNKQLTDTVAEMNAKIVTGMTDNEKADLQARFEQAKTQYADAIARSQGQFAFAQKAAETSSAATQQGLQDVFKAQQALAAQALGQTAVAAPGAGYIADVAGAQRAAQQNAAAGLAVTGGDLSVPQGALVRTPPLAAGPGTTLAGATAGGLIGVSGATADLYKQMLEGSRARALTDLEAQRTAVDQAIRIAADQSARQREEQERARVQSFEQNAMASLLAQTTQMNSKYAELAASAAGADTTTERQKAAAEIAKLKKQEDIRLAADLKRIAAQARASASGSGLSAQQAAAEQDVKNYQAGQAAIGKTLDSGLQAFVNRFTNTEKIGDWSYLGGELVYTKALPGTGGKSLQAKVDPQLVFYNLQARVGSVLGRKPAEQRAIIDRYLNTELAPAEREFLRTTFPLAKNGQYWVDLASGKTPQVQLTSPPPGFVLPPMSVPQKGPSAGSRPTPQTSLPAILPTFGSSNQVKAWSKANGTSYTDARGMRWTLTGGFGGRPFEWSNATSRVPAVR
jgi:hypothetical protein